MIKNTGIPRKRVFIFYVHQSQFLHWLLIVGLLPSFHAGHILWLLTVFVTRLLIYDLETQSLDPISCYMKPVEGTSEIVHPLISLVHPSGFM